ncbi:hypothetical protein FRB99_004915 [Tulasnella sp. 403]|nr:hypothetical protein FRB99_004915 [Tulasnella sp. 403]
MSTSSTSQKFRIPHPNESGCTLVGIIEQVTNNASIDMSNNLRPIALILHGVLGHKDYLFQKRLALRLPLDSCRFDFRANHESNGSWRMSGFDQDVEDIKAVVSHLTQLGYRVELVVAHSRGSVAAMRWISTTPEGRGISGFVNVAGRYRMELIDVYRTMWNEEFEKNGFAVWKARVAKKDVAFIVRPKDLDEFASFDTSYVWTEFPQSVDVLTIQGLRDKMVPPFDAIIYARAFSGRPYATHTLHLIEEADHNFFGHYDEVVNTMLGWWDNKTRVMATTGSDDAKPSFLVQPPFDHDSSGDCILQTPCGTQFKVFRNILSLASPVFKTMFDLPQPSISSSPTVDLANLPIIVVTETAKVMQELLRILYPMEVVQLRSIDLVFSLVEACDKYEIPLSKVVAAARDLFSKAWFTKLTTDPLEMYALAWRLKLSPDAERLSDHTHHADLKNDARMTKLVGQSGTLQSLMQLYDLRLRREKHIRVVMDAFKPRQYFCAHHKAKSQQQTSQFEKLMRNVLDDPNPVNRHIVPCLRTRPPAWPSGLRVVCGESPGCFSFEGADQRIENAILELFRLFLAHPDEIIGF